MYGLDNSERYIKMFVSLLEGLKRLTGFQLMIVYLLVFVGLIDDSVFVNTPAEIGLVIRGFREKIASLSSKFELNKISKGVLAYSALKMFCSAPKFSHFWNF